MVRLRHASVGGFVHHFGPPDVRELGRQQCFLDFCICEFWTEPMAYSVNGT
jgi:hypothetical protein